MAHDPPHPRPTASASILRLPVWQRLVAATLLSLLLWGVIYWAMNG